MIIIQLTQNKQALIDDQFTELADYKWQYDQKTGYAKRKFMIDGKRKSVYLHKMIYEQLTGEKTAKGMLVDHINNNRLDCQSYNLRLATYSQNNSNKHSKGNKTGYKWVKSSGLKFTSQITFEGVKYKSHKFDTALEAYEWSVVKALEIQGKFAKIDNWVNIYVQNQK